MRSYYRRRSARSQPVSPAVGLLAIAVLIATLIPPGIALERSNLLVALIALCVLVASAAMGTLLYSAWRVRQRIRALAIADI